MERVVGDGGLDGGESGAGVRGCVGAGLGDRDRLGDVFWLE